MNNHLELKEIKPTLDQVCRAIVSVLGVDITIVDSEYIRITGTGRYATSTGEILKGNGVFKRSLELGESLIVDNPRDNGICKPCNNKEDCKEFAQVCCPIRIGSETVGIMGLAAFSLEQRHLLLSNKEKMLDFVENMADLIVSKIRENRESRKASLMAGELALLFDAMDNALITTDQTGVILRYNRIAEEFLGLKTSRSQKDRSIEGKNLKDMLSLRGSITTAAVEAQGGQIISKEFSYYEGDKRKRGYYSAKQVFSAGQVSGYLFTLTKANQLIKIVAAISGGQVPTHFEDILGSSREMVGLRAHAARMAEGSSTILIQGETGTGKEIFARAIHYGSKRSTGPFVAINCSAIPETLIESELFGYEEGAFTGASKGGKLGKFELASRGTLFLDEIGDMPLNLQTKLLRVLQDGVVERVGGNVLIPVDVRIIAATNKDLETMVEEKEFRKDLFYRLNVIPVTLPPLRDRKSDLSELAKSFLIKYNLKLEAKIKGFNQQVFELFEDYDWPGNVRELENTVEFAVNMCKTAYIEIHDLPKRLRLYRDKDEKDSEKGPIRQLKVVEEELIRRAIQKTGTPEKAAVVLGIGRATIYRKIKTYGI